MRILYITLVFLLSFQASFATEYIYIHNDKNLNKLYNEANDFFKDTGIIVYKEIRGVGLVFSLKNIENEFVEITNGTKIKLNKIENFLAKIKNPAIIEVHTDKNFQSGLYNYKNWEITTVIANKIEEVLIKRGNLDRSRIKSVGYGEFLPIKNTSNNGVKPNGNVDIIILCNIDGE